MVVFPSLGDMPCMTVASLILIKAVDHSAVLYPLGMLRLRSRLKLPFSTMVPLAFSW